MVLLRSRSASSATTTTESSISETASPFAEVTFAILVRPTIESTIAWKVSVSVLPAVNVSIVQPSVGGIES